MVLIMVLQVMKVVLGCFTGNEGENDEVMSENESKLEIGMPTKRMKCGVIQKTDVSYCNDFISDVNYSLPHNINTQLTVEFP
jgi:hypothetical protein